MSSILRAPRQIDSQLRFFVAIDSFTPFTPAELHDAVITNTSSRVTRVDGSVISTSNASGFVGAIATDGASFSAGNSFRDMGESLYIQEDGVNHYIYRLAQPINGIDTEGVDGVNVYLLVWSSAGLGIAVVRTGY